MLQINKENNAVIPNVISNIPTKAGTLPKRSAIHPNKKPPATEPVKKSD